MKRTILLVATLILAAISVTAQVSTQNARRVRSGTADPNSPALACVTGPPYTDVYLRTSDHSVYQCTGASTWTKVVSGGTPVSGSGTSGQVAAWSGTSSLTGISTSLLEVDTANSAVGVGTTTPNSFGKFAVRGFVTVGTITGNVSGHFSDAVNGSLYISHATGYTNLSSDGDLALSTGGTPAERVRIGSSSGNFKIAGTASRGTTEGTNHLDIFNGTAPVGTLANGFSLYSASGVASVAEADGASGKLPIVVGTTSQKSETASADTNVLTVTPVSAIGTYEVCYVASVASATSGVISFTLSYKDSNGNTQTNIAQPLFQAGTAAPNTTFTTSSAGNYHGCSRVDTDNTGTNLVVKWVGGGTTSAKVSAYITRIN